MLFTWAIILQAFGAVYWPAALGFLAASPGVPLLLMAGVAALSCKRFDAENRPTLRLLGWGFACSLVAFALLGWNVLYASKVLPLAVLSLVWLSPVLCTVHISVQSLRLGLVGALTICLVGFVVNDLFSGLLPSELRSAIFAPDYVDYLDARARGFMAETGHFATLVGRYSLLLLLLQDAGKRFDVLRFGIPMAFLTLMLAMIASKGVAIAGAVALVVIGMRRRQLPYLLLLVPLGWAVFQVQIETIQIDLENYTSTSTRFGLIVAALAATVVNPLGWGYYGFYGAVQQYGNWSMEALSNLPLLFAEMKSIVENLVNVSFKSTLLDFVTVFGIGFLIYLWDMIRRMDLNDPRVRSSLAYLLISALTTSGHESVSFFLGLAVLMRFYPRQLPRRSPIVARLPSPPKAHSPTLLKDAALNPPGSP